jgi:hypothetical protein
VHPAIAAIATTPIIRPANIMARERMSMILPPAVHPLPGGSRRAANGGDAQCIDRIWLNRHGYIGVSSVACAAKIHRRTSTTEIPHRSYLKNRVAASENLTTLGGFRAKEDKYNDQVVSLSLSPRCGTVSEEILHIVNFCDAQTYEN